MVSKKHLLAEFIVLDTSGEFNMCKLIPKQLWFEEALDKNSKNVMEGLQNGRSNRNGADTVNKWTGFRMKLEMELELY